MTMNESKFVTVEHELREQLTALIARERGIDRTNRLYPECRERAVRLINEHRGRLPFTPTTDIERILVGIIDNEQARRAHRREVAAARSPLVADALHEIRPASNPTIVKLVVREESTGKLLRLTLPADSVEDKW
jgi:hypothetical protein